MVQGLNFPIYQEEQPLFKTLGIFLLQILSINSLKLQSNYKANYKVKYLIIQLCHSDKIFMSTVTASAVIS